MTQLATNTTRTFADGASITPAGNHDVHITYKGYGAGMYLYRVEVLTTGPVAMLVGDDHRSFGHPDREQAQAVAEHYRDNLVEVLTVEQTGISDARIAEVADGINADLDTQRAQDRAWLDALNADIDAIRATSRGFRDDRTSDRCATHPDHPATTCPACATTGLAATVPTTGTRPVRPTMAGAHRAPLSGPQIRALNSHRHGVVVPGDDIQRSTLNALARKGYGQPRYDGNRKKIVALDLNTRGLTAANRQEATR